MHEIDVIKIIKKLQNEYLAYWLNCKNEIYHEIKNCANWEFIRIKYDGFKFDMKYMKNYAYINCLLSYNWYLKYIEEEMRKCRCKNMIISMMMYYKLIYHEQKMIKRLVEKKFEREKNYIE